MIIHKYIFLIMRVSNDTNRLLKMFIVYLSITIVLHCIISFATTIKTIQSFDRAFKYNLLRPIIRRYRVTTDICIHFMKVVYYIVKITL